MWTRVMKTLITISNSKPTMFGLKLLFRTRLVIYRQLLNSFRQGEKKQANASKTSGSFYWPRPKLGTSSSHMLPEFWVKVCKGQQNIIWDELNRWKLRSQSKRNFISDYTSLLKIWSLALILTVWSAITRTGIKSWDLQIYWSTWILARCFYGN